MRGLGKSLYFLCKVTLSTHCKNIKKSCNVDKSFKCMVKISDCSCFNQVGGQPIFIPNILTI